MSSKLNFCVVTDKYDQSLLSEEVRDLTNLNFFVNFNSFNCWLSKNAVPDILLLDTSFGDEEDLSLLESINANPILSSISTVLVTDNLNYSYETIAFEFGVDEIIHTPFDIHAFNRRIKNQILLVNQEIQFKKTIDKLNDELTESRRDVIECLGKAAEYKDNETGLHVIRMAHYSKLIADTLTHDKKWVQLIFDAAPMHDIGKIGIPDAILNKQSKLDSDEWEMMKKHPSFGEQILSEGNSELITLAREIAKNHHEKWDGTGYPCGLIAEEIPLSARIIAIADVFDALTSVRPYKKAWSMEAAFAEIGKLSGTAFDPKLVEIFLANQQTISKIKTEFSDA